MFALLALAHVPTYCQDNCCTPPHDSGVSQVLYLKGSGGLELERAELRGLVDFDVVFRDEVNTSRFRVHVGCGGCMPGDPILTPSRSVAYERAVVEPFTQTVYRSLFPPALRTLNVTALGDCASEHVTVRLVQLDEGAPIVWGAVVGLGEAFTLAELLAFPVYILRNHGPSWNDLGYTYWLWLFLVSPPYVVAGRALWRRCCGLFTPSALDRATTGAAFLREVLLDISLIGFVAAVLEIVTHLIYAQSQAPVGSGLWVCLLVMVGIANVLPMALLYLTWVASRRRWRPWIPAVEVTSGVALLLLFGSGLYVGPVALTLAGLAGLFVSAPALAASTTDTGTTRAPPRRGYAAELPSTRDWRRATMHI